jgi:hypothetical protein
MLHPDTELTTKFLNKFEEKATEEAHKFLDDLEKELHNRF